MRAKTTVNKPDEWLPCLAFRYYQNEEQKHLLPFIGVLFDYEDEDIKPKLQEPLLTAGWQDYGTGGEVNYELYHDALIHVYIPGWRADGKWHPSDPRTIFTKAKGWSVRTAPRCRSFALPLMSFASAEYLTRMVIDPLLEDIQSSSRKAKAK